VPEPVEPEVARVDEQVVGPDLVLTTETTGDRSLIAIKGELDAYTAPAVEEQISKLMSSGAKNISLDLSETGFLDSSGLRAILTAHRRLENEHGALTLRRPSEPVTRLLEITGLTDHFRVERG
jgi:anti-sigma B factor antagonist